MHRFDPPASSETQDFQADGAPSLWQQTTVMPLGAGEHEAFSVGPDQRVWSYRLATREHDAGRLMCTELLADQFAGARLQDRRVLLASMAQNKLYWTVETGQPKRWSEPALIACPQLDALHGLEQVHLLPLGFEVLLGVLTRRSNVLHKISPRLASGDGYQFWVGRWTGAGFDFGRKPVSLRGDDSLGNAFLFGKTGEFADTAGGMERRRLMNALATP